MTNLNQSSKQPWRASVLVWIFLGLAAVGFADASYLTVLHWQGEVPECSLTHGCDVVLGSEYATVGAVPVALVGAVYYLAVASLTVVFLDSKRKAALRLAVVMVVAGFVVSLYMLYLQFFVLEALCQFCLFSAGTTTALAVLGVALWRSNHSHRVDVG